MKNKKQLLLSYIILIISFIDAYSENTNTTTVTVTDADKNMYGTVQIGQQIWTTSNLRTTKYNDGTAISHVSDSSDWSRLNAPAYCYYNNTTNKQEQREYCVLYNWYAVNTGKLAPVGWHVPSDSEWTVLEDYLVENGYNYDGTTSGNKIGKSLASKNGWGLSSKVGDVGNNVESNNRSGFSALPMGYRDCDASFNYLGLNGVWWSSTAVSKLNASYRYLLYDYEYLGRENDCKQGGFSVRLVKD